MKNLLITLMVLLIVLAAGTALAGDMTYKVYGKLHTSLNYVNDGDQTGFTMTSNTSRFGVKGGVELNESVKAIYQFENSLDIANRGGALAWRNTFLGIKGKFGTFLAGIHDTPFKTLGRKVTFFKDQVGDFRTATLGYDQRLENVIVYVVPKQEKWGGQLAYQLDQNDWQGDGAVDGYSAATALSAMVYFTPGDFFIGAAYENWSKGYFEEFPVDGTDAASGAVRVAAKWTGEKFAASGLFQTVSNLWNIDGNTGTTFGLEALFKAAEKWHVKGNFYNASAEPDGGESACFSQFALGVDHVFAPSTMFYLQWAMVSNGDMTAAGIGGGDIDGDGSRDYGNGFGAYYAPAITDGTAESPMAISLGVVHSF